MQRQSSWKVVPLGQAQHCYCLHIVVQELVLVAVSSPGGVGLLLRLLFFLLLTMPALIFLIAMFVGYVVSKLILGIRAMFSCECCMR